MKNFYYPIVSFVLGIIVFLLSVSTKHYNIGFISVIFFLFPLGFLVYSIIKKDKSSIISSAITFFLILLLFNAVYGRPMMEAPLTSRCDLQSDIRCTGNVEVNSDGTFEFEVLAAEDLNIISFSLGNDNCTSYENFTMQAAEEKTFEFDCAYGPDFGYKNEDIIIKYTKGSILTKRTIQGGLLLRSK